MERRDVILLLLLFSFSYNYYYYYDDSELKIFSQSNENMFSELLN